jgi:hypothetical protein
MKLDIIWRYLPTKDEKPKPAEAKITPMDAKFKEYPNFTS